MSETPLPADSQKPYPNDKDGLSPTVAVVDGIKIRSRQPSDKADRK